MKTLGLIGFPLSHSFSKKYFTEKFENEGIQDFRYELFPIQNVEEIYKLLQTNQELIGLNVTIPHKIQIIPLLDELDEQSKAIGAVNTICIRKNNINGRPYLKGYNTDVYGFEKSLVPLLKPSHTKALILGTGGASMAVRFVLDNIGITYTMVSRNPKNDELSYTDLQEKEITEHTLIINCSPVGMHPYADQCPYIPYDYITSEHVFYDLVYNPLETLFLQKAKLKGANTKNGLEMLLLQAEKSWEIWNMETEIMR